MGKSHPIKSVCHLVGEMNLTGAEEQR